MMTTCVKIRRKSTDKDPNDMQGQSQTIDPMIAELGWELVGRRDLSGVSRWEMKDEAEELIAWIKELQPTYAVFQRQDRIGFQGAEFFWFKTELERKTGTKLFLAESREEVSNDPMSLMKCFMGQTVSDGEIVAKGFRTQVGRRKTIMKCSSPGGDSPYGFDWGVYDRSGKLRYTIIRAGQVQCEGTHYTKRKKGSTDKRRHNNWATCRIIRWPDGTEEPCNDTWVKDELGEWRRERVKPKLSDGDTKQWIKNPQQATVVKTIYTLADKPEWKTPYEIAKYLNDQHIPALTPKGIWTDSIVTIVLRNPIHKGHPMDNTTSIAKTQRVYTDAIEYPLTDHERDAIRIVPEDVWERANSHARQPLKNKRRRTDHSKFWASNFVVCADCGTICHIKSANPTTKVDYYQCRHCNHQVRRDVIHDIIDMWLTSLRDKYVGQQSMPEDADVALRMIEFVKKNTKKKDYDNLVAESKTRPVDNMDWIGTMYSQVHDKVHAAERKRIVAIDAEMDDMFRWGKSAPAMREKCNAETEKLLEEKSAIVTACASLLPEYRAVRAACREVGKTLQQLQESVTGASGENKALLLKKHLHEVKVHWGNGRWVKFASAEVISVDNTLPPFVVTEEQGAALIKKYSVKGQRPVRDKSQDGRHT